MADRALSAEEQQALLKEFDKVEQSAVCGGFISDCIIQIDNLSKEYLSV
jgi:hypothetical protein